MHHAGPAWFSSAPSETDSAPRSVCCRMWRRHTKKKSCASPSPLQPVLGKGYLGREEKDRPEAPSKQTLPGYSATGPRAGNDTTESNVQLPPLPPPPPKQQPPWPYSLSLKQRQFYNLPRKQVARSCMVHPTVGEFSFSLKRKINSGQ